MMAAADTDLALKIEPAGSKHKITVSAGGNVVFVDTLNLSSAAARGRFVAAVAAKFPAADRDALDAELVRLAGAGQTPAAGANQFQEVDVRRVVRPELFHTAEVSGITVPVVLDLGGKLSARWRTYMRWAEGKREVIDRPDRIVLSGGSMLYVHPDAGEPTTQPAGWSALSRRQWLAGAVAPDPAAVFRRLCERIALYLDFPPESAAGTAATVALWLLLTYWFPAWEAVPYLSVGGPVGSGKTRLIDILGQLAFRPVSTSNLTAPGVFRTLNAYGGTMLYDEAERLRQATPDVEELRSVFLAGYKRGGAAIRLEPVGDGFRPMRFEVFGPKALACIAGLPAALASRCIPITMFRAAGDSQKPKRRIDAEPAVWQSIRDELHVLALEYGPTWVDRATWANGVPAGIAGRNFELWQPLLALAGWLQDRGAENLLEVVQQHALATVASARDDTVPEADELLLELLAEAVRESRPPTSAELLKAAKERDEVTFKSWSPKTVGTRLKGYGIGTPKKVNGERRYKDVTLDALARIGERYGIDLGLAVPKAAAPWS